MSEHRVPGAASVPIGATRSATIDEIEVLFCNVDGTLYAIEDVCTHDGAPLDAGELEGACIVCPRHGARFDVRTGEALTLPAILPVITFPVRVDGEDAIVEV